MRLLLVEDNQADVFLVEDAMRHEGVDVEIHIATDGENAIEIIQGTDASKQNLEVDCFLIDLNLPRRGGSDVLRAVRQSHRYAQSPVVMMTSSVFPMEHQEMIAAGATEVFVKPFQLSEFRELVQVIQRICTEHAARKS